MRRSVSCLMVLLMLLTMMPLYASAEESTTSEHYLSAADTEGSEWFQPMTREEYIAEMAVSKGITYSQAEEILDQAIDAAIASIPAPMSWEGDTYVNNGDSTHTIYGRVFVNYLDDSGMSVTYSVQAALVKSNYGSTWVSCNENGTYVPGSGAYTFYGSCTASIITTRQLRLVLDGYFEISFSDAWSIGVDLEVCEYSYTSGFTTYYRRPVYQVHVETTRVQGGV